MILKSNGDGKGTLVSHILHASGNTLICQEDTNKKLPYPRDKQSYRSNYNTGIADESEQKSKPCRLPVTSAEGKYKVMINIVPLII